MIRFSVPVLCLLAVLATSGPAWCASVIQLVYTANTYGEYRPCPT